jgi:hypothetical protein
MGVIIGALVFLAGICVGTWWEKRAFQRALHKKFAATNAMLQKSRGEYVEKRDYTQNHTFSEPIKWDVEDNS